MIHMIYLAAGNAKRFGSQKLLYRYQDKKIYQYGLDMLLEVVKQREDCKLSVVYRENEIQEDNPNVEMIYSPDSDKGLSYTIKKGLESVGENEHIMFIVSDQIFLTATTVMQLIDTFYASKKLIARVRCNQRFGNPVIFHASLKEEFNQLENDQGGKIVIQNHKNEQVFLDIENEKELYDIDTIEDINNL